MTISYRQLLRLRAAIAALATVGGMFFLLPLVIADPAYATTSFSVLQFNICGNSCYGGSTTPDQATVNSILSHRPIAVTLNEVCYAQVDDIFRKLMAQGYTMSRYFDQTIPRLANGCDYGNAVFSRGIITSPTSAQLHGIGEARRVLCVQTSVPKVTELCVTHLSADGTTAGADPEVQRAQQVRDVNYFASLQYIVPKPVIIGGDFNTTPGDAIMNPMYNGYFTEAAVRGNGPATNGGRHIDYVFVSPRDYIPNGEQALSHTVSDHNPLLAFAYF